jgi:hypothetical protein
MKKFDEKKIKFDLENILISKKIDNDSAITSILNNISMYNLMINNFKFCKKEKLQFKDTYTMYSLNIQIFKQLKEFGLVPNFKKDSININSEDEFLNKIDKK